MNVEGTGLEMAAGRGEPFHSAKGRAKFAWFVLWLVPFLISAFSERNFQSAGGAIIHNIGERSTLTAGIAVLLIILLFLKSFQSKYINNVFWILLVLDAGVAFFTSMESGSFGYVRSAVAGEETGLYRALFWLPLFKLFKITPSLKTLIFTENIYIKGLLSSAVLTPIAFVIKFPSSGDDETRGTRETARRKIIMGILLLLFIILIFPWGFSRVYSGRVRRLQKSEDSVVTGLYKLEYRIVPDSADTLRAKSMLMGDREGAIDLLSEAFSRDDSTAAVALGELYENSEFFERDVSKSKAFFLRGAQRGNLAALSGFARVYWGDEREKLMEFAVEKGDRHSYTTQLLGLYYMQGRVVDADYLKSAYYYGIAAEEGSIEGAWQMAGFFYRGYMMKRDLDKAAYWANAARHADGSRMNFYREQAGLLLIRIEKKRCQNANRATCLSK
jgi:hypothetical protein